MSQDIKLASSIIAERLKRSEIFSDLCQEELLSIASFCTEATYDEGIAILVEGEPAETLLVVERGKLGTTLIVESLADKYLEHQPVERQCLRWSRTGVDIAPQTLGRSVGAAIDVLAPVARMIRDQTRGPGLLATDATGIPVLDRDAPDGIRQGTVWCWTNARWVSFVYSAQGDSASALVWAQRRLKRARLVLDSWRQGEALPPVEAELQAWRIGDLALATASGEIFNQIGRRIKEGSPFVETCFVGYLNGSIGYVPVREAYPEGGYEVTHACQVDPEAGDLVENGCLELLRGLA